MLGQVHFYHPTSVAGRMWNFSLVWTLHMGRFHSLSLFPSDMKLKAFPCVCWRLLAPRWYWGTISMKRPRWVSRSFSLVCQIAFQANPTCSFLLVEFGLLLSLWIFVYASVVLECSLSCFIGSFQNVKLTMKMTKHSYWIIFSRCAYSLQFLGGGQGQDLLLTGCQAVHHITSAEYTHGKSSCSGPRASLDKPLPF